VWRDISLRCVQQAKPQSCTAQKSSQIHFDEAVAKYERILARYPNYPLAHFHLGQAFEHKGETHKASLAYQQFLQIWKDADPELREVMVSTNRLK
jgi:tetratricopeptide (TPR) repeat protein